MSDDPDTDIFRIRPTSGESLPDAQESVAGTDPAVKRSLTLAQKNRLGPFAKLHSGHSGGGFHGGMNYRERSHEYDEVNAQRDAFETPVTINLPPPEKPEIRIIHCAGRDFLGFVFSTGPLKYFLNIRAEAGIKPYPDLWLSYKNDSVAINPIIAMNRNCAEFALRVIKSFVESDKDGKPSLEKLDKCNILGHKPSDILRAYEVSMQIYKETLPPNRKIELLKRQSEVVDRQEFRDKKTTIASRDEDAHLILLPAVFPAYKDQPISAMARAMAFTRGNLTYIINLRDIDGQPDVQFHVAKETSVSNHVCKMTQEDAVYALSVFESELPEIHRAALNKTMAALHKKALELPSSQSIATNKLLDLEL